MGGALGCALVTGASGFLGRRLCARLRAEGVRVRALSRRPGEGPWEDALALDLATAPLPPGALAGVDTVFHLAARTHALGERGDEPLYRALNVEGTRRVVEAAVAAGVARLVLASSVKAIGEGGPHCLDEDSPEAPASAYGRSKLEAERLVQAAGRTRAIHTAVLRLTLLYGSGAPGNLARMLAAVRRHRFPPIPECGNRRSLLHVDDAVEALLLAARRPEAAGRTYIVTGPRPYSTREIYEAMCRALGREPPRWSVPLAALRLLARAGDAGGRLAGRRLPLDSAALDKLAGSAWYSARRIERELGFRARRELAESLLEMAAAESL